MKLYGAACNLDAVHIIIFVFAKSWLGSVDSISRKYAANILLTKLHPKSISSTTPAIKYAQFNPPTMKNTVQHNN